MFIIKTFQFLAFNLKSTQTMRNHTLSCFLFNLSIGKYCSAQKDEVIGSLGTIYLSSFGLIFVKKKIICLVNKILQNILYQRNFKKKKKNTVAFLFKKLAEQPKSARKSGFCPSTFCLFFWHVRCVTLSQNFLCPLRN